MKKNLTDSYEKYKDEVENPLDKKTYLSIAEKYIKFLIEKVLEGFEVTLPSRFGTLCIIGKKQKIRLDKDGKITGLPPDWVKTKELWNSNEEAKKNKKLIYHTNTHTDNIRYKYFWSKRRVIVENKTLYALRMTRTNKRAAHAMIKQGKKYITKEINYGKADKSFF